MELKNNQYKWKKNLTYASKSDDIKVAEKEWKNIKMTLVSNEKIYNCICSAKIKNSFIIYNPQTDNYALVGSNCLKKIDLNSKRSSDTSKIVSSSFEKVEYDELDIDKYLEQIRLIVENERLKIIRIQEELEAKREKERLERIRIQKELESKREKERLERIKIQKESEAKREKERLERIRIQKELESKREKERLEKENEEKWDKAQEDLTFRKFNSSGLFLRELRKNKNGKMQLMYTPNNINLISI